MSRRVRLAVALVALLLGGGCVVLPAGVMRSAALGTGMLAGSRILRSTVTEPISPSSEVPAGSDRSRIPLGTKAPTFELSEALGEVFRSEDFRKSPVLVLTFTSRACALDRAERPALVKFVEDVKKNGVVVVVVNSNNPARSPEDAMEKIAAEVAAAGYPFPYLVDYKQEVGHAFLADRTAEFYVFDQNRKLAYLGPFDGIALDSTEPANGAFLRKAVDDVLAKRKTKLETSPSVGCPIPWKVEGGPVGRASSDLDASKTRP